MAKYLDLTGLTTFWTKVKSWVAAAVTTNGPSTFKTVTGWNEGKLTYGNIQIFESQVINLQTHLDEKAPLVGPALTGTPTAPTAATGTNTTQIATTEFVNAEIDLKMGESDAMIYKGPIEGGSSGSYGALTPAANKGWTYKVKTAGKLDGVEVFVGDLLVCGVDNTPAATANNYATVWENWDYYPGNTDGAVIGPSSATGDHVAVFDGATGKLIKDSGKTIGKSVPSDAVFTDTKVTSAGNHYAPAEDSSSQLDADASGATAAWALDVVTGVTIKRDAKGHVTGLSVDSGKLPANPGDTKVTQDSNSEDKEFPLLAKYTNNTTNETNTSKYAAGVTVNPSKKQISATKFKGALEGNADTASAAASGSALEAALDSKADKVANATSGNFAGLDANGNLTDSGKKASDFATAAQGTKADSAVQGIKLAGASSALTPDSSKVVTIPDAVATGTTGATNGLMTAADKQKLNSISATTTSVTVGSTTFNKYTDDEAKAAIGISSSGDSDKFLNENGLFTKVPFEGLFEAVYGETSYNDVASAINGKKIVFCRVPTSTGKRMAFFAYADGATLVEFQYYRSRGLRSESDYSDEVYVYQVKSSGWTTIIRKAGITYAPGTNMSQSFDATTNTMTFNSLVTNVTLGQGYGTCTTAEATAAKVVTLSNYALATGGIVAVKFTNGLCANATLNINSKGAKSVFIHGAAATSTTCKEVKAGDVAYFIYDGTQYQFLGTDRMEKDSVTGFSDSGTAGTNAKVTYTKGDGTTGDLMVAITDAEIAALS
jgi:hypothetical protein